MTSNDPSVKPTTKASNPEKYARGITSLARCYRGVRGVGFGTANQASVETDGSLQRHGAVYGPLTAAQTEFNDDMDAEIARQDANPAAYILPSRTPEQLAKAFGVPLKMCRGLGTEA